MPRYRNKLPQLSGDLFLTDGGLETTMIFHEGLDLPEFAAFVLLEDEGGLETLRNYYRGYANIASEQNVGFILESVTWRASEDWGVKLGYSPVQIADFNHKGIELLLEIRDEYNEKIQPIVISGCMGPRGDGYLVEKTMTADEAQDYHRTQIATFRETEADMVTSFTIPYAAEAIGIARAAKSEGLPVVIGFTVETDGRLPSGETLRYAIAQVDEDTDGSPEYYMVNCAHPTHFIKILDKRPWSQRIRAIRSNASTKSHAELDEATELNEGNPFELSVQYLELLDRNESLNVFGGCCGTDPRHIREICKKVISNA